MAGNDDEQRPDDGAPDPRSDDTVAGDRHESGRDPDESSDVAERAESSADPAPASAGLPAPGSADAAVDPTPAPPDPVDPALPASDPQAPPPMVDPVSRSSRPAPAVSHYRSDQDRARSVRRRANPWYRRLARGLILLSIVGLLGVGLYFGIRELQDYVERDRLPEQAADVPEFKSTTFQVRSSAAAPNLDGTLTIDVRTNAYEYVGRPAGVHSGTLVVSPTGSGEVFMRVGNEPWRRARPDEPVVDEIERAIPYLVEIDNVDVLLPTELRRGYVDLERRVTEGAGDLELTRYEVTIDTREFSDDYPLQWRRFEDRAIPGVAEDRDLPVTFWLDTDDLVVRLRDAATNWAWERLAYSDTTFEPMDPSAVVVEEPEPVADEQAEPTVTTEPADG